MKNTLSVVFAVYNEEAQLGDCLQSVKTIADEIIVVDGQSTDHTVEVAKRFGARVISAKHEVMFHRNKQLALDAARGAWVLQLDADERVSPELAKEILQVVRGGSADTPSAKQRALFLRHQRQIEQRDRSAGASEGEVVAYFVPRLNFFLGGYLRHGGVYPDGVIRLVARGKAHFPCKDVHEQISVDGRVGWLAHDLLHHGDPTFSRYLARANTYTSLTADRFAHESLSTSIINTIFYMFLKPFLVFCTLFFRHRGFLDGFPGFVFALFSGLHFPLAYMKYWERMHER